MTLDTLEKTKIALTDKQLAEAINMSLSFVRKDRITKRIIPFFRLGDSIRYDVQTVRKALLSRMEGGVQ